MALESNVDGFVAETETSEMLTATYAIAATKNTVDFFEGIDGVELVPLVSANSHASSPRAIPTSRREREVKGTAPGPCSGRC